MKNVCLLALSSLLLLCAFNVNAQSALEKRGDKFYEDFDFDKAIAYYKKVVDADPSNTYAKLRIADSYRLMNDPIKAEEWYSLIINNEGVDEITQYYYAQALRSNEKYEDAKEFFNTYASKAEKGNFASNIAKGINYIDQLSKENPSYEVKLLEINTSESDFGPQFYKNGIIFTSNRNHDNVVKRTDNWTSNSFLQLYTAEKEGDVFQEPVKLSYGKPNLKYHEGPAWVNKNATEMYLTRSNYVNPYKVGKSTDNTVKLKIYKTGYDETIDNWSDKIVSAVHFNSDEYSVANPSLTKDGKTMYFGSDMPGGEGGVDIWMTTNTGGTWSAPVNLGDKINTPGNERFPFIADDGTLYFSSDGHFGLGGLDVYQVKKKGNSWGSVGNLGAPINSNRDDFGYAINEKNQFGYFASNREGGYGDDDIYSFKKLGSVLEGIVYDAATGENISGATVSLFVGNSNEGNKLSGGNGDFKYLVDQNKDYRITATKPDYFPGEVNITTSSDNTFVKIPLNRNEGIKLEVLVKDKKTKQPIDLAEIELIETRSNKVEKSVTDETGKSYFSLQPNLTYKVVASKETDTDNFKYLTTSTDINTFGKRSPSTVYATLELDYVQKNVAIKIENIYYDLDKAFIRPDAAIELDKLVKILNDNPTIEIELSSHTDCRASASYNMDLSSRRAASAVAYLIERGINSNRLRSAGYGESRLVNRCECEGARKVACSENEHQQNRRTEFKILKF